MPERDPTSALANPSGSLIPQLTLSPPRGPTIRPTGWEGTLGAIAMLAGEFSEGMRESKIINYIRSEEANRQALQTYMAEAQRLLSDPEALTKEGREEIARRYASVLSSLIDEGAKGKGAGRGKAEQAGIGGLFRQILKVGLSTITGGEVPPQSLGKIDVKKEIGELHTIARQHSLQEKERQLGEQLVSRISQLRQENPYISREEVVSDPQVASLIGKASQEIGRMPGNAAIILESFRTRGKPEEEMLYGVLSARRHPAQQPQALPSPPVQPGQPESVPGTAAAPAPTSVAAPAVVSGAAGPAQEAPGPGMQEAAREERPKAPETAWYLLQQSKMVGSPVKVRLPDDTIRTGIYVPPGASLYGIPPGWYDASTLERLPDKTMEYKPERPFVVSMYDQKSNRDHTYLVTPEGKTIRLGPSARDPQRLLESREDREITDRALGYLIDIEKKYNQTLADADRWLAQAMNAINLKNISAIQQLGFNISTEEFNRNQQEATERARRMALDQAWLRKEEARRNRRTEIQRWQALFGDRLSLKRLSESVVSEEFLEEPQEPGVVTGRQLREGR